MSLFKSENNKLTSFRFTKFTIKKKNISVELWGTSEQTIPYAIVHHNDTHTVTAKVNSRVTSLNWTYEPVLPDFFIKFREIFRSGNVFHIKWTLLEFLKFLFKFKCIINITINTKCCWNRKSKKEEEYIEVNHWLSDMPTKLHVL